MSIWIIDETLANSLNAQVPNAAYFEDGAWRFDDRQRSYINELVANGTINGPFDFSAIDAFQAAPESDPEEETDLNAIIATLRGNIEGLVSVVDTLLQRKVPTNGSYRTTSATNVNLTGTGYRVTLDPTHSNSEPGIASLADGNRAIVLPAGRAQFCLVPELTGGTAVQRGDLYCDWYLDGTLYRRQFCNFYQRGQQSHIRTSHPVIIWLPLSTAEFRVEARLVRKTTESSPIVLQSTSEMSFIHWPA